MEIGLALGAMGALTTLVIVAPQSTVSPAGIRKRGVWTGLGVMGLVIFSTFEGMEGSLLLGMVIGVGIMASQASGIGVRAQSALYGHMAILLVVPRSMSSTGVFLVVLSLLDVLSILAVLTVGIKHPTAYLLVQAALTGVVWTASTLGGSTLMVIGVIGKLGGGFAVYYLSSLYMPAQRIPSLLGYIGGSATCLVYAIGPQLPTAPATLLVTPLLVVIIVWLAAQRIQVSTAYILATTSALSTTALTVVSTQAGYLASTTASVYAVTAQPAWYIFCLLV